MEIDFIVLIKAGVGPVLVRYADIIVMETTPVGCTRLDFGYGDSMIVEENILCVIEKIKAAKLLNEIEIVSPANNTK